MPHYATGEAAQVGDVVRGQDGSNGPVFVGHVIEIFPGADACNASVVTGGKPARLSNGTIVLDGASTKTVTCADLEKLDGPPAPAEQQETAGTAGDATGSGS